MRAYTRRRLLASAKLGLAAVPCAVVLRLAQGGPVLPGTALMGFTFGFVVGVAELFWLHNRMRQMSFFLHLVAKSLVIVALMYVCFVLLNLLDVLLDGISWAQYRDAISNLNVVIGLAEGLGVIAFLLFFVQLDRLLGPGLLLGYVTGRYHRPRREDRVFLFLDLKGSTTIADHLEPEAYFAFLHQYFTEMSEPILETDAEIYQYVGDEIVLTWRMEAGLEESSCVRAFFLIRDQINAQRERFEDAYGVVPDFKGGLHAGEVITAQIGELKSEIVYNGDVLNTGARIQSLCGPLGHELLVSAGLLARLDLGPDYAVDHLGPVELRGKADPIELCAVSRVVPSPSLP